METYFKGGLEMTESIDRKRIPIKFYQAVPVFIYKLVFIGVIYLH